ncbi:MAG: hypothetical protein NVS3B20_13050 [Polyangiales bacterium]
MHTGAPSNPESSSKGINLAPTRTEQREPILRNTKALAVNGHWTKKPGSYALTHIVVMLSEPHRRDTEPHPSSS